MKKSLPNVSTQSSFTYKNEYQTWAKANMKLKQSKLIKSNGDLSKFVF